MALGVVLLSGRPLRVIDVGVWNGPSHEDIPTIAIPMWKAMLRIVNEITTLATEVMTNRVHRDSPQVRMRRAIWSRMGRLGE